MRKTAFQSTLPIQGETRIHFAIHSKNNISIHSPYTGRDMVWDICHTPGIVFQSTLPIQGETQLIWVEGTNGLISIHSPYTGRDGTEYGGVIGDIDFNPLSLYRERPYLKQMLSELGNFNPLSLYRERRYREENRSKNLKGFQSTLPIQGETLSDVLPVFPNSDFNPLSLYRERQSQVSGIF